MNSEKNTLGSARLRMITATTIFGTVGIVRKAIPLSSAMVACMRGLIAVLFLLVLAALRHQHISGRDIRSNAARLLISGAMIGFNWILLFEAYQYTSVAAATLCYYIAPIFVILAAPLVLHERITPKKLLCVLLALIGMALVSGIGSESAGSNQLRGILLALSAAVLYATVILINKKMGKISAENKTLVQLATAAAVIVPYILLTEDISAIQIKGDTLLWLLLAGVINTGLAYTFYFGAIRELPTQSVALYSYLDPIVAVILSALLLKESFTLINLLGAILILGSTCISELSGQKKTAGNETA